MDPVCHTLAGAALGKEVVTLRVGPGERNGDVQEPRQRPALVEIAKNVSTHQHDGTLANKFG